MFLCPKRELCHLCPLTAIGTTLGMVSCMA